MIPPSTIYQWLQYGPYILIMAIVVIIFGPEKLKAKVLQQEEERA
jgi:Sec-independent protein translocase protein TatA